MGWWAVRGAQWAAVSIVFVFLVSNANAADTVETFPLGARDFEFFTGAQGIGRGPTDTEFFSETLAGFGIAPRLSGYLAAAGQANGYFEEGGGRISFGLFGTAFESEHFDRDISLHTGFDDGAYWMAPALEMNFDAAQDLEAWGCYLRVNGHLAGRGNALTALQGSLAEGKSHGEGDFAPHTELTVGAYWSVTKESQILVESDYSYRFDPSEGERAVEVGSIALGYNFILLAGAVEWVNQLSFDIPEGDEGMAFGITTGVIATLE